MIGARYQRDDCVRKKCTSSLNGAELDFTLLSVDEVTSAMFCLQETVKYKSTRHSVDHCRYRRNCVHLYSLITGSFTIVEDNTLIVNCVSLISNSFLIGDNSKIPHELQMRLPSTIGNVQDIFRYQNETYISKMFRYLFLPDSLFH